jgi:TetR/AcrR family transcriptional regulator
MGTNTDAMKWRQEGSANPLDQNAGLFNAALDVFSAQSYGEASLNDIIRTAGLNKGSFYYRFYDKMDLYLSLIHKLAMQKLTVFKQYDDDNPDGDFFADIKRKAVLGLRFARQEPRYNALFRRILAEESPVRGVINDCFGDITQNVVTGMIEDGKKSGRIRADISTPLAAAVFSTILNQIDLMISPAMDDEALLSQVDELVSALSDGMGAR